MWNTAFLGKSFSIYKKSKIIFEYEISMACLTPLVKVCESTLSDTNLFKAKKPVAKTVSQTLALLRFIQVASTGHMLHDRCFCVHHPLAPPSNPVRQVLLQTRKRGLRASHCLSHVSELRFEFSSV